VLIDKECDHPAAPEDRWSPKRRESGHPTDPTRVNRPG
jgi:hypothetical protein